MNKESIISFLKDNGMDDIEEIKFNDKVLVFRFFFDFDDDELNAAKAYANDECEEDEESEAWYEEFYLPYLSDLAVDNVGDILEELMEELEISSQFISYNVEKESSEYSEIVAIFHEEDEEVEIEKILDELNI
ncbi:MAG: hypothetical protein Q8936_01230 [Bacillota bacterium]|nr:hypothetical protein [Bacillota bacterium]